MKKRRKIKVIVLLVFILGMGSLAFWYWNQGNTRPTTYKGVFVRAEPRIDFAGGIRNGYIYQS